MNRQVSIFRREAEVNATLHNAALLGDFTHDFRAPR